MKTVLLVTSRPQSDACRAELEKNHKSILVINTGGQITAVDSNKPVSLTSSGEIEEHWVLRKDKSKLLEYIEGINDGNVSFVLAADGSIESEKIAFDLSSLGLGDKIKITVMSSLNYKDILSSMSAAREINHDRARAASVRKIIDALIGVRLSSVMRWHLRGSGYNIPENLSVGRIMCPALKVLCDNKKEIDSHESEQFVRLKCWYRKGTERFEILDKTRFFVDSYDHTVQMKHLQNKLTGNSHIVTNYSQKQREESPPEPLYLSLLEIAAFNCYRYKSEMVAKLAEELYTSGYISNFRTNSNQISETTFDAVVSYLYQTIREDDVVDIQRKWKRREGSTFDEFAIVPIFFDQEHTPENIRNLWSKKGDTHLDKAHYEIYALIWHRTLATQMENAFFDATELSVQVLDHKMKIVANKALVEKSEEGEEYERLGWLSLNRTLLRNSITINEEGQKEEELIIPYHEIGEEMVRVDVTQYQTGTQPPKRYGEARFIKTLEKLRIAQPGSLSMLAQKMETHGLLEYKGIVLHVRALGTRLNAWIEANAPFLNNIEEVVKVSHALKQIEEGEHPDPDNLIRKIMHEIQKVEENLAYDPDETNEKPSFLDIQKARAIAKDKGLVLGASVLEHRSLLEVFLRKHGEFTEDTKIDLPDEVLGRCPSCKEGSIVRRDKFYGCSAHEKAKCKFRLNIGFTLSFFERYGISEMEPALLDKIVSTMLSSEYAEVHNMISSDGKTFIGKICIIPKNNFWNVSFYKKETTE